ncbi:MAG: glycosyltransferase [Promethearchaeota archaeon]
MNFTNSSLFYAFSYVFCPLYLIKYSIFNFLNYSTYVPWLIRIHKILNILIQISFSFVVILSTIYLIMGIIAYNKPKVESPSINLDEAPFVTIQIPTYNELAAINCALACLNFDYPKDKMEIIIGDDSNDPEISKQIDIFTQKHPNQIKVTRRGSNEGFKPGNLNFMLKFTKGDFIAIFDSDFLPPRNFLKKALYPFRNNPKLAAVQTRWKISNLTQNFYSLLGGMTAYVTHYIAIPFMQHIGGSAFICGSGHITKKSHLESIGGWRVGSLTEDIEASLEFIKNGKTIDYIPDVLVECEAPFKFKDLILQQKRWASGNITAFKRNLLKIWKSPNINKRKKISASIFTTGYLYPYFLLFLIIWGLISNVIPNPIAPPFNLIGFILGTIGSTLVTSGALIASSLVLIEKKQQKLIPKFLFGTFTIGIGLLIYVNIGIYSGLFNRKIPWYMIEKQGNSQVPLDLDIEA